MKKIIIIIVLLLVSMACIGITYSKYNNKVKSNSNISLATFLVDTKMEDHINIPISSIKPGDSVNYEFVISNNSNDKKSDVSIKYNIIIKTMHFIPLDIEIFNKNDESILVCDELIERNSSNELECISNDIIMPYQENVKDEYYIKIDFPEEYSSLEYSSLVDYLNIEIQSSQQID